MKNNKISILLTAVLTISGCGGGGGGGSNSSGSEQVTSSINLSTGQSVYNLQDGDTVLVNITNDYSGTGSLSYSLKVNGHAASDIPGLTWSVNGTTLSLSADSLELPSGTATFELTVTDGSDRGNTNFSVLVGDTTLNALLEKGQFYKEHYSDIAKATEVDVLDTAYGNVLDLLSVNTSDLASYSSTVSFTGELSNLTAALDTASSGGGETELTSAISDIEAKFNQVANERLTYANEKVGLTHVLTSLPSVYITYQGNGSYSYFEGNDSYGQYSNDAWQYNADLEFVGELISSNENCSI